VEYALADFVPSPVAPVAGGISVNTLGAVATAALFVAVFPKNAMKRSPAVTGVTAGAKSGFPHATEQIEWASTVELSPEYSTPTAAYV
jgi:hypothetical protein